MIKKDYVDRVLPTTASASVKMGSISDLPPAIQGKLRKLFPRILPKGCFANALVGMVDPSIFYVEGVFSLNGIPIEHAWNRYNDIHFDLTSEVLFNGDISRGSADYVSVQESNNKVEVKSWVSSGLSAIVRVSRLLRKST